MPRGAAEGKSRGAKIAPRGYGERLRGANRARREWKSRGVNRAGHVPFLRKNRVSDVSGVSGENKGQLALSAREKSLAPRRKSVGERRGARLFFAAHILADELQDGELAEQAADNAVGVGALQSRRGEVR